MGLYHNLPDFSQGRSAKYLLAKSSLYCLIFCTLVDFDNSFYAFNVSWRAFFSDFCAFSAQLVVEKLELEVRNRGTTTRAIDARGCHEAAHLAVELVIPRCRGVKETIVTDVFRASELWIMEAGDVVWKIEFRIVSSGSGL